MVESRSASNCSIYVPGAPDKIAPSEARAEFGAFLAGASISPSVPSRAPEEYCAQSRIPAAPITAANTVATRVTAVKYLRSSIGGLRRREEGGGRLVTWITTAGREKRPKHVTPPESPKFQTSVARVSNSNLIERHELIRVRFTRGARP